MSSESIHELHYEEMKYDNVPVGSDLRRWTSN